MNQIPPQATEIEESLLGAMLLEKNALEALDLLSADDFYDPRNQIIFKAIGTLHSERKPINLLTVETYLKDREESIESFYLSDLTSIARFGNEEYFSEIIRDKAQKRKVISECVKLIEQAYSSNSTAYDLIDAMIGVLTLVDGSSNEQKSFTPSEIHERELNTPKVKKIYTGFSIIDNSIYASSGANLGHVEVTMAESGHGKTEYAQMINGMRANRGNKIHWFQLEDYDVNTANYFLRNYPDKMDNVIICDSLEDIEAIKREARKYKKEFETDVIVIDYVQNVDCSQKFQADKIEFVSKELRKLAKHLRVVVHLLSQVTIAGDRRGWKLEPTYNDVRWSKQLKQDAHLMTSVFRPNKVDELIEVDLMGTNKVKDWNGNKQPFDSVYSRQVKVRGGKQEFSRLHMIHGDLGLKPYSPI